MLFMVVIQYFIDYGERLLYKQIYTETWGIIVQNLEKLGFTDKWQDDDYKREWLNYSVIRKLLNHIPLLLSQRLHHVVKCDFGLAFLLNTIFPEVKPIEPSERLHRGVRQDANEQSDANKLGTTPLKVLVWYTINADVMIFWLGVKWKFERWSIVKIIVRHYNLLWLTLVKLYSTKSKNWASSFKIFRADKPPTRTSWTTPSPKCKLRSRPSY